MNHKDRMKLSKKEVRVRKSWGLLNPATRVEKSAKEYRRSKAKQAWKSDYGW